MRKNHTRVLLALLCVAVLCLGTAHARGEDGEHGEGGGGGGGGGHGEGGGGGYGEGDESEEEDECSRAEDCPQSEDPCEEVRCVDNECFVRQVANCKSCYRDRECDDENPCTRDICRQRRCWNEAVDVECDPETWFVVPLLECVDELDDGRLRAHFGYRNDFWTPISLQAGNSKNKFSPSPKDRGQPSSFQQGAYADVVQVEFSPSLQDLTWTLRSPDGSTRVATASDDSPRCAQQPECTTNDDCFDPEQLCSLGTCHYGECRFAPKLCDDGNPCTINDRCDAQTGACLSDPYLCEDQNPCTEDTCVPAGDSVRCVHEPIDGCELPEDPEDCPHEVEIQVDDCSVFEITELPDHVYQFCHSSTYLGNQSAVVLDFSPYQRCSLNERGTCSNHYAEHEQPDVFCVDEALYDVEQDQCSLISGDHALAMPGLASNLVWIAPHMGGHNATFAFDEQAGTAHLQGVLVDPQNASLQLRLDVWFSDLSSEGDTPQGSPKQELPAQCYAQLIDTADWRYFGTVNGVLTARPGTAYEGLHITLVRNGPSFQMGVGANGKNPHFGASGWFDWRVTQQPTDPQLRLYNPTTYGDFNLDLNVDCTEQLDYCSLFGEPQEAPSNGWQVVLDGGNITYCRNYTIEELLGCRSFDDPNTRLFNSTQDQDSHLIVYVGKLHATTLRPRHCEYHQWSECGEEVAFDTHYDIEISIDAQGTISVSYLVSDVGFSARWVRNVWLHSGDLKVVIETRVRHIESTEQDPFSTRLIDGVLDSSQETGYPLQLVSPVVPCRNEDGFCYQEWCLVSEDARQSQITDFSGIKPLDFTMEVNGEERVLVKVRIDLKAKHIGSQAHLDGAIDANLQLYTDRYLQDAYSYESGRSFGDCDTVYAVLRLLYQQHLAVRAQKIYICFSPDGNIPPYNPRYPQITGCAAPGAIRRLIYSDDAADQAYIDQQADQFQFISEPPNGAHQLGFQFEAHAFTRYRQLVQVHWYAEESGGSGALIEGITEYDLGTESARYSESDYQHANYAVRCPHDQVYDYTHNHCSYSYAHGTHSVWFVVIAIIFICFFVLVLAYLFGWCACCLGAGWISDRYVYAPKHEVRKQPHGVYAPATQTVTYVDDRDTYTVTNGNGNLMRLRGASGGSQTSVTDFDV